MKTVLITLTTAGVDTGPFDLYSNADGYATPFQSNVAKSLLVAGYSATNVPDLATIIRVKSLGVCTNQIDLTINASPTTTTTSSGGSPTTTSTTTGGGSPTTTTTSTSSVPSSTVSWLYSRSEGEGETLFTIKKNGLTVVSTSTNNDSGTFSYVAGDILTATSTSNPAVDDTTSVCIFYEPTGAAVAQDIPTENMDATTATTASLGNYYIYGCQRDSTSALPCECSA